jgi:chromosome segregation ATPase
MGLFNRRAETKKELDALRAEIQMVRSRLNESEEEKRRLTEHLGHLGSAQERLTTQIGTVEQQVGAVEHHVVTVAGSIGPAINSAVVQASSAADVELIPTHIAPHRGHANHLEKQRENLAPHQQAVANNRDAATQ